MIHTTPELRIGRKERDITLNILAEAYVDERIQTREEYDERVEKTLLATTQTQLDILTADLPPAIVKKDSQHNTLVHDTNASDESYDSDNKEDEKDVRWNKMGLTTLLCGFLLVFSIVGPFWFYAVLAVVPSTEMQTATVTSSTPISCNENTCNYPMVLTTNAGEKVEVEGEFHKSSLGWPVLVPIGEEMVFQRINEGWEEWRVGEFSIEDRVFNATVLTILTISLLLFFVYILRHPEKFGGEGEIAHRRRKT